MKYSRKGLSFLTALLCLAGSLLPLRVSAAAAEEVPRVVFENEQNSTPDLYVTKKVESASGSLELPQNLSFTFVLKLDGELADRLPYRVFDESGTEVFDEILGMQTGFKTDRSGTFTLKPGQTAKFEYVGAGVAYEVTELPKEGWEQVQPAGGAPAAGTVTDKGAWAEFTNLTGGGGNARLVVRKSISFPNGYEIPETPEFLFQVKLEGKPYAQEAYDIIDTASTKVVGSGTTDAEGKFSLRGGQSADFREVPENVDYEVTEITAEAPEGWRAVGETEKEGTTGAGGTTVLNFHNANASFAVTKKLEDDSKPDTEFTFLLTRADHSVWMGAKYLLYQTDGTPVTDENGDQTLGVTDKNGNFSLKPGQAAVFTGIEPGTLYHVSEVGRADYVQLVPGAAEGYTNKVVSDAVEVLPFVNRLADSGLTVTKVLEHMTGDAPLEQREFTFILSRQADDSWRVMANTDYSIEVGTSQNTYQTDAEGKFTLKANETARFTGLPEGSYKVEEDVTDFGPEYEQKEPVQYQEITAAERNVNFLFKNRYNTRYFDLYLYKKNRDGDLLDGAEFMLYRDELLTNPVEEEPYTTGVDGKIHVEDLKTGIYYLVETKSPEGYRLLVNPVKIEVTWEGSSMQVQVDDRVVTSGEEDDQIYIKPGEDTGDERKYDEVHITIYNSRNFTLPATGGGAGIPAAIALAGGMFLLLLVFGRRRTRNRE